jgi:hypothetical protein
MVLSCKFVVVVVLYMVLNYKFVVVVLKFNCFCFFGGAGSPEIFCGTFALTDVRNTSKQ